MSSSQGREAGPARKSPRPARSRPGRPRTADPFSCLDAPDFSQAAQALAVKRQPEPVAGIITSSASRPGPACRPDSVARTSYPSSRLNDHTNRPSSSIRSPVGRTCRIRLGHRQRGQARPLAVACAEQALVVVVVVLLVVVLRLELRLELRL